MYLIAFQYVPPFCCRGGYSERDPIFSSECVAQTQVISHRATIDQRDNASRWHKIEFLELEEKAKEMKLLQRQNEELKIHAERAKKLAEDLKVSILPQY